MVELKVLKKSGQTEDYREEKLRRSLKFTKATDEQIEKVLHYVKAHLRPHISTRRIYTLAFNRLRKLGRPLSANYGTKKALLELGPDGFIFEQYTAKILEYLGYKTLTNVDILGKCVSHEVDVVAEKRKEENQDKLERLLIECKFHRSNERRNDLKTVLYIKARSEDIAAGPRKGDFTRFLLISNTSFSEEAIRYATCAELSIWGANFPPQNTLQDIIRQYRLDPVTCLASLKKAEKKKLLEKGVLLIRELLDNPKLLELIELDEQRAQKVFQEIRKLVHNHDIPDHVSLSLW